MTILQKLVGCYDGSTFSKWGNFDHLNPLQHIRCRICDKLDRIADTPSHCRWKLANLLSKLAHRLRGGKSRHLGWDCYGNTAASLEDHLTMALCVGEPVTIEREEADELLIAVRQLAAMARATHWVDYKRAETDE